MKLYFPPYITVSFSRIKSYRRCPMQHHYRYVQKLRPKKKARPLKLGTAIHRMLEARINTGSWVEEWEAFNEEFGRLFEEERAELGDLPGLARTVMEGYENQYDGEDLSYIQRRKAKAEIRLELFIHDWLKFVGVVDAYPQDSHGKNWLMDHKTHKNLPGEDARFSDLQLVTYAWLLPLAGYPKPDGIIWDYVRTKEPSQPQVLKSGELSTRKLDTTREVFLKAVQDHYGRVPPEFQELADQYNSDGFFRRVYLPSPNNTMVETISNDMISTAREIYEKGETNMVRNMTRDCSWCPYYNLCQAEVRGLDADYIRKKDFTDGRKEKA